MAEIANAKKKPISERLARVITMGRDKGRLTYDELNNLLPEDVASPEEIDELLTLLGKENIEIVDKPSSPSTAASRLEDGDAAALVTELVTLAQSVDARDQAFEESLRRLATRARQRELEELREQLRAAQAAGQESDVHRLLSVIQRRLSTAPVNVTSGG